MAGRKRLRIQRHRAVGAGEHELGQFEPHEQRQHHHVQRPQPGKPHRHEADAVGAVVEALAIGVAEHEAGEGKEHVDAKLQIGERADVLQRMVNGNME